MKELTLCLMTSGEETEQQCLEAIKPFRDKIEFTEVRNVFPQVKALNQMIDQVETEFFIPLDADIILKEDAYQRISNAINKKRHDIKWHSILFSLWDTLTERKILALKILRTSIMKEHLFKDVPTPDVEHYKRLTNEGYTCVHDYIKLRPIGDHVVRGHHYCYNKYRDVYMTYRAHNFEWDSGVFMGGDGLRGRSKNHFEFFVYKWAMTRNEDYLSCIAGMVDGITATPENKSKTLDRYEYSISKKEAISAYWDWYFGFSQDSGSCLF